MAKQSFEEDDGEKVLGKRCNDYERIAVSNMENGSRCSLAKFILRMIAAPLSHTSNCLSALQDVRVNFRNKDIDAYYIYDATYSSPVTNWTFLEEILEGDCFTNTQYQLNFKVDKIEETLCEKKLTSDDVAMFRKAIHNEFVFEMFYNNIRMQWLVGEVGVESENSSNIRYYLVKHIHFYANSIGDRVKNILVMGELSSAVDITEDSGRTVKFTYSVSWNKRKYTDESPVKQEKDISFLIFIFLICVWIGMLTIIIVPYYRSYLKRDLRRTHGHRCRCPRFTSLLGAILGTGIQLFILCCTLFILAYVGFVGRCNQFTMIRSTLMVHGMAFVVSGYVATAFHTNYRETGIGWKECLFQTGCICLAPVCLTFIFTNSVSKLVFGVIDTDIGAMAPTFFIWAAGSFSSLVYAGRSGYKDFRSVPPLPCATSRVQGVAHPGSGHHISKPIEPQGLWFIHPPVDNLHFAHSSDYSGGHYFHTDSILQAARRGLVVEIVSPSLLFETTEIEISCFYLRRSIFRGGSTAIFLFMYGIYFHAEVLNMPINTLKLFMFMCYDACFFYALFLMLGTVGFCSSYLVHRERQKAVHEHDS
ncbi:transmembrane 9 superfamily member 4-like [Diospyros lotus]|uniref:transmembrane 9 superfamily member 4-like n=1 Tax=Diospyros lotus TaxID=55363 RepID=UPI00225987BA|nr:transmembrane 9 superfamily member 4-like [Diospyros lotus]